MNASVHPSSWSLCFLSRNTAVAHPNRVCRHFQERGEKPPLLFDYTVALTHGVKLAGKCQDLLSLQAPAPDGQREQRHMQNAVLRPRTAHPNNQNMPYESKCKVKKSELLRPWKFSGLSDSCFSKKPQI